MLNFFFCFVLLFVFIFALVLSGYLILSLLFWFVEGCCHCLFLLCLSSLVSVSHPHASHPGPSLYCCLFLLYALSRSRTDPEVDRRFCAQLSCNSTKFSYLKYKMSLFAFGKKLLTEAVMSSFVSRRLKKKNAEAFTVPRGDL